MAEFVSQGLEGLMLDLAAVAEMPKKVQADILNAEADVVVEAQRRKVKQFGIYDGTSPVHVASSIKKGKPKTKKGQRVIYITSEGTRTRGKKKLSETRNAEILFVNEFGKRGQRARPAIATANEESAAETTAAGAQVWSNFLTKNNL